MSNPNWVELCIKSTTVNVSNCYKYQLAASEKKITYLNIMTHLLVRYIRSDLLLIAYSSPNLVINNPELNDILNILSKDSYVFVK